MNDHEIMNELRKLSDEELKQASLEKETKGMTKLEALKLMRTVIDYEIEWLEVSGDEQ